MEYSTLQEPLIMPEYGRNVQRMVEYALTIEDREERTRCVQAIMQTMSNLFPYLKTEESRHKMYDHLAVMSNFRLDIDFPYNRPDPESLRYKPERLPYNTERPVRFRHYGRLIENMIEEAAQEQDKEKREQLTLRIANRMRYYFSLWNKDNNVDEQRIKEDITYLSNGRLDCNFNGFQLNSLPKTAAQEGGNNKNQRRKKKKNKQGN